MSESTLAMGSSSRPQSRTKPLLISISRLEMRLGPSSRQSRRDHHHRPGFRGECFERSCLGAGCRRARAPRASLPKTSVRLGRFPPTVNRLIGLWWLAKILYPDLFPEDLRALTQEFYARFYHVTLSDAQIERVLAGRD